MVSNIVKGVDKKYLKMKNNKFILAIGQLLFVFGFLGNIINYFYLNNNPFIVCFASILFGLSIVLNLIYLIRKKKEKEI